MPAIAGSSPRPGGPLRDNWQSIFRDAGLLVPTVSIECGLAMTIRELLVGSDSLALPSPAQVALELEAGWLRMICPAPAGVFRSIGVTQRRSWHPTALQQALVDELTAAGGNGR